MTKSPYAVPLRPDLSARASRPAGAVVRLAAANLLANINRVKVDDVIAERWKNDDVLPMLCRAAVSPAMTTDLTSLAASAVGDFLVSLGPKSAGSVLLSRGLALTFGPTSGISVPGISASASGAGFVKQGDPIPLREQSLDGALLSPRKLAGICVFTRETFEHTTPTIESVVGTVMRENVGLALDALLFDATAGSDTRPAGILYGVSANSPSAETDLREAMLEDIEGLLLDVAPVAGNNPIAIVASPVRASKMRLRLAYAGDPGFEIIASSAVGDDMLIAVATNGLISASDPVPRIDVNKVSTVVMQNPGVVVVNGSSTPSANTRSMWQTNSVGMRVIFETDWALRTAAAVSWVELGDVVIGMTDTTDLSPEVMKRWDAWLDDRLVGVARMLGEEAARTNNKLRDDVKAAMDVLRKDIGDLKLENAYLRGLVDRGSRGPEVIDLPALPKRLEQQS